MVSKAATFSLLFQQVLDCFSCHHSSPVLCRLLQCRLGFLLVPTLHTCKQDTLFPYTAVDCICSCPPPVLSSRWPPLLCSHALESCCTPATHSLQEILADCGMLRDCVTCHHCCSCHCCGQSKMSTYLARGLGYPKKNLSQIKKGKYHNG